MNSIFGKPLNQVEYEDVISFCESGIKESLYLDYKLDLSNVTKIVKTLVSFANTAGGYVIIGVGDDDDKPQLPVTGMSMIESPEQAVNNSIIQNVHPIVLPEYRVLHSPDNLHTIMIAYMPMSRATPHWMTHDKKTVLYVRVADRASGIYSESYATDIEWEMLQKKRDKSIELRMILDKELEYLYRSNVRILERYNTSQVIIPSLAHTTPRTSQYDYTKGCASVYIRPVFPVSPIFSVKDINAKSRDQIQSNGYMEYPIQTPFSNGNIPKTYQRGAYYCYDYEFFQQHKTYFFGMNTYGGLLNIFPVQKYLKDGDGKLFASINIEPIANSVAGALAFMATCYQSVAYNTQLIITLKLNLEEGVLLQAPKIGNTHWPSIDEDFPRNATGELDVDIEFNANELLDTTNRIEAVRQILEEVFYAFNYQCITDKIIELIARGSVRGSG